MTDSRKYYFDWLRVIVVLLIIPHHAALTYSHIGKGYVYTKEPIQSLYYFIQSDFLNVWFMIILFFISGLSAYYSLSKRGAKGFMKERIKKLLIPVLVYLLILGPLTAFYVQRVYAHTGISLINFYVVYLHNIQTYLGWAQMWYCAYLFTFSLIALPIFHYLLKDRTIVQKVNTFLMKKYHLFLPMIFIVFLEITLRPYFPGYQNLIHDWANFTVYLTFFILGFFLSQSTPIFDTIKHLFAYFLTIALVSTIFYIIIDYQKIDQIWSNPYLLPMLKGFAEYSWVMVMITISKQYLNFTNPILKGLSRSSFGLYIFHYPIVTIINVFLLPLAINHYFKFLIAIVFTYLVYYVFYSLIITKIKPLRFLCGL